MTLAQTCGAVHSFARALGGDVVGHQVLCPGPGHSTKDRSLSVRISPTSPDGFVIFSHAGDDVGRCKDHVRSRLGWGRPGRRSERLAAPAPASIAPDGKELANIDRAQAIWHEAADPKDSLVERYLSSRGLTLPSEVAGGAIRFHRACPWNDDGKVIRVPAMIAALRSISTQELTGIHRTRLTPDGKKVGRRMLGKASGAAIMLCPFSALGAGITIGEGIETCLAAWQIGWSNVWALGSVGAIRTFPLIGGIQSIVLLAEGDDSGASAEAIEAVGERYDQAGREVLVVEPRCRGDMNDVVRGAT